LTSESEDRSSDSPLWVLGFRGSKEDPKRRNRGIIEVALRPKPAAYRVYFLIKKQKTKIIYMRKIILCLATSLDGYIEGPNGEIDWMEFSEETGKALSTFLQEIDTILYGRVSYEAWGNYTPPENAPAFEKDFYEITNSMQKYVFSRSKTAFEGEPIVIQNNLEQTMRELKAKPGKNIWLYGGASLVTGFVNAGLIDEFRIAVIPIILGSGKPLFKDIQKRVKLKLLKIDSDDTGIVSYNYQKLDE
jgi:dihydrofolate reductase